MERTPSAVVQVCEISELVHEILGYVVGRPYKNKCSPRESAGLMRVNKVWHSQAIRHIWRKCGQSDGPWRYDLAKMWASPERLQHYADCIEVMEFNNEEDRVRRWGQPKEIPEIRERFEELLPSITFQRLRCIKLRERVVNPVSLTLPYMKYTKAFKGEIDVLSVEFWDSFKVGIPCLYILKSRSLMIRLQLHSNQLEKLYLCGSQSELGMHQAEALRGFIGSAVRLTDITFFEVESSRPSRMFQCFTQIGALKRLQLHLDANRVSTKSVLEMRISGADPFRRLRKLSILISERGLNLLVPCIGNLEDLELGLTKGISTESVEFLCGLPKLQSLHVTSRRTSTLAGRALVNLAEHCPMLTSIEIGDVRKHPLAFEISDLVILEVAKCLPRLKRLRLCADLTRLTEQSILHLGEHCKSLQRLELSADPDYVKLANLGSEGMFPVLNDIVIWKDRTSRSNSFYAPTKEDYEALAERLVRMMPRCQHFEAYKVWGRCKSRTDKKWRTSLNKLFVQALTRSGLRNDGVHCSDEPNCQASPDEDFRAAVESFFTQFNLEPVRTARRGRQRHSP